MLLPLRLVGCLGFNSPLSQYFTLYPGWSGGAMVPSKLLVPGRPTIWISVGQGPTALLVGAGWGCLDIFYSHLSFLSSFSLPLRDGPIQTEILSERAVKPKTTNQLNHSISGHLPKRGRKRREKIDESENVRTTPTRTYRKRSRPLPKYRHKCTTPRHWKFTQDHRTTRPPPTDTSAARIRND